MKGFDKEFTDIVDYIIRITDRIWKEKQVEFCHKYYSDDCPLYTLAGMSVGAEEVTQNTLNTLAAFPDRTLVADNVLWNGNPEEGFHTSHLISSEMTNLGDSELGPATGKHAKIQVIAHCVVKNNKIIEEWLVRDNYSLVEQLGLDPQKIAQQNAMQKPQARFQHWCQSELNRVPNVTSSSPVYIQHQSTSERLVLGALQNIWNARMVDDVNKIYNKNASLHASANNNIEGHEQIASFYSSFLDTFSELSVAFDYSCQQPNSNGGEDVAVRWTMVGKHTGNKLFDEPTDAPILVIGESQYRIQDSEIIEEWTVFDQLAILTQIYRARNQVNNA